jgi:hypothetical protein
LGGGLPIVPLLLCLAQLASASVTASTPQTVENSVRKLASQAAYLPTSLPAGYRFLAWKNESPNHIPQVDERWFMVTFDHRGIRLLWTVTVIDAEPGIDACQATSVGHSKLAGKTIYWGPLETYEPLGSGAKGRHVWRCINAPGGGIGAIKLDAFDQHAALPIPETEGVVARASNS